MSDHPEKPLNPDRIEAPVSGRKSSEPSTAREDGMRRDGSLTSNEQLYCRCGTLESVDHGCPVTYAGAKIKIERLRTALGNLVSVFSCNSSAVERQREIENGRAALGGDFSKMAILLCAHCGGENRAPLSGDSSAPETKSECTVGVGDGPGELFVNGSYEAVKRVQSIIRRLEKSTEALRNVREHGCNECVECAVAINRLLGSPEETSAPPAVLRHTPAHGMRRS